MKKKYMKPVAKAVRMETQGILAGSFDVDVDNTTIGLDEVE